MTECPGHPIREIPLTELRRAACQAIRDARESAITDFRVTDDDGTERTARREDLLELAASATSKQGLAELLLILQESAPAATTTAPK